jgi:hypothetical protein
VSTHDPAGPPALTGERHGALVALCTRLHDILVGRAAQALLVEPAAVPEECSVWAAPSWLWTFSRIDVGRKGRAADGGRLRLPVRLEWSTGAVALVRPGQPIDQGWTATGLGHTGSGVLRVESAQGLDRDIVRENETGLPTFARLAALTRQEALGALERLVADGAQARWETLLWLEPHLDQALHRAHASVASELAEHWGSRRALLDDTKLRAIADVMLLGDEDQPGKVAQMLERCLRAETFRKVEPSRYIKEALRRDANTEVRRAIGDPHIGAKIRRVARELGPRSDLDSVITAYRARYPRDRLSRDRAVAALSVSADVMASWWELVPERVA